MSDKDKKRKRKEPSTKKKKRKKSDKKVLKIGFDNGVIFKKLIDCMQKIISQNETVFKCDSTGISVSAMDSAHVCLVKLELKAESLDVYEIYEPISFCINLPIMLKILGSLSGKLVITKEYGKPNKDGEYIDSSSIMIEINDGEEGVSCKLQEMQCEQDELGIPSQEFQYIYEMSSSLFKTICTDMINISYGTVKMIANADLTFILSDDGINYNRTLRNKAVEFQENHTIECSFALKYLNDFSKSSTLSKNVTINLDPNLPMKVSYMIGEDMGNLMFYLAPKIDDEDYD